MPHYTLLCGSLGQHKQSILQSKNSIPIFVYFTHNAHTHSQRHTHRILCIYVFMYVYICVYIYIYNSASSNAAVRFVRFWFINSTITSGLWRKMICFSWQLFVSNPVIMGFFFQPPKSVANTNGSHNKGSARFRVSSSMSIAEQMRKRYVSIYFCASVTFASFQLKYFVQANLKRLCCRQTSLIHTDAFPAMLQGFGWHVLT